MQRHRPDRKAKRQSWKRHAQIKFSTAADIQPASRCSHSDRPGLVFGPGLAREPARTRRPVLLTFALPAAGRLAFCFGAAASKGHLLGLTPSVGSCSERAQGLGSSAQGCWEEKIALLGDARAAAGEWSAAASVAFASQAQTTWAGQALGCPQALRALGQEHSFALAGGLQRYLPNKPWCFAHLGQQSACHPCWRRRLQYVQRLSRPQQSLQSKHHPKQMSAFHQPTCWVKSHGADSRAAKPACAIHGSSCHLATGSYGARIYLGTNPFRSHLSPWPRRPLAYGVGRPRAEPVFLQCLAIALFFFLGGV